MSIKEELEEQDALDAAEVKSKITDPSNANIINVSGGKDSTALLLKIIEEEVPFRAVFADTGHEHQITYDYIDYLQEVTGIEIEKIKEDFTDKINTRKNNLRKRWEKEGIPEERISEAEELLKPTGNPMFDLCLANGAFPNSLRKFCTNDLKIQPVRKYVYQPVWDEGKEVISWQGVRRGESKNRERARLFEWFEYGKQRAHWVYRPLVNWTARDVFDMHKKHGVKHNPLYEMGMSRVGCMPCINARKEEIFQIYNRFPERLELMEEWEKKISTVSTRGKATFFDVPIKEKFEWSMTKHGGKELDMRKLMEQEGAPTCSSVYGLCE